MTANESWEGRRTHALWVAGAVLALTLLTWFGFPGHTWLRSDTQIYMPILERLWDPAALPRELLAQHPHVAFTIYDEVAIGLRRITGLDFESVLEAQQFLFRALGILGMFLLATSMRLSSRMALIVAAVFSVGAFIAGPTVMSVELEPVPRGFAVLLLFFAVGLAGHARYVSAGTVIAVAFLYHAPTVLPFWLVYLAAVIWPSAPEVRRRRLLGLIPILSGVLVLWIMSRIQAGIHEPQAFFGTVGPELERLQRMRAPYNWVSLWEAQWYLYYAVLLVIALVAFWRVRESASQNVRLFLAGLPLVGVLSVPVSYVLLDRWKWVLVPQVQPARAVLFITVIAGILGAIAAVKVSRERRYWEGAVWLLIALAIPASTYAGAPALRGQDSDLRALTAWARGSTPPETVFLFPDAGRELYPGEFRARALRAVYVDWKGGGQVNFLPSFAAEWSARWQRTGAGEFVPGQEAQYRAWGIDYFVLKKSHRLSDRTPVFEDANFLAYRP